MEKIQDFNLARISVKLSTNYYSAEDIEKSLALGKHVTDIVREATVNSAVESITVTETRRATFGYPKVR
jgi:hypothetical protein